MGESGSKIVINASSPLHLAGIKGELTGSYPDFVHHGNDYFFRNVIIEVNIAGGGGSTGANNGYGFYNCANLANCAGTGNGGYGKDGYGFHTCANLTNCAGTGNGGLNNGSGYGFHTCRTGIGCKKGGASTTATFSSCYMEQSSGTTPWDNTYQGGYNNPA